MGVCSMVHGMWSMVMHPLMGILNTYDGILMDIVDVYMYIYMYIPDNGLMNIDDHSTTWGASIQLLTMPHME